MTGVDLADPRAPFLDALASRLSTDLDFLPLLVAIDDALRVVEGVVIVDDDVAADDLLALLLFDLELALSRLCVADAEDLPVEDVEVLLLFPAFPSTFRFMEEFQ